MSETDSLLPRVSIRINHRCSSVGKVILSESEKRLVEQASSILSEDEEVQSGEHCHAIRNIAAIDKKARNRLVLASVLCLFFMAAEIVGGVIAGSLAIISDAAHLLTDFASFMVSLLALLLVSRQPTKKLSFGWYRAEILGALLSILLLWVLTGIVVYMAIKRIISNDYDINATVMLIVAACGVAFNLFMGLTLHQHSHGHGGHSHNTSNDNHSHSTSHNAINEADDPNRDTVVVDSSSHGHSHDNINVRAAFIHVVGDLIQSVGVLIAAIIIYFKPEWKIADPICTFVFSVIVMVTTFTVVRDILIVLMEGTPRGLNFEEVQNSFSCIPGVKDLHDLRMWSLSLNKIALSVHIAVDKSTDPLKVLKLASAMVQQKYGIAESTIQVEEYIAEMENCTHCRDLPD